MEIIYDRERDEFLERMRKTYVKRTLFQLSDLENVRSTIEGIAKSEEKNDISAIEWYKNCPVVLNNVEYDAALIKVGHAFDIAPNKEEDEKVLKALKENHGDKIGKRFGIKIDVIAPFIRKNFLRYSLK